MKKIIIVMVLLFITISCEKQHCYICDQKLYENNRCVFVHSETKCEMTEDEIKQYEINNTSELNGVFMDCYRDK